MAFAHVALSRYLRESIVRYITMAHYSNTQLAAVDSQNSSGNIASTIACNPNQCLCHLLRVAETLQSVVTLCTIWASKRYHFRIISRICQDWRVNSSGSNVSCLISKNWGSPDLPWSDRVDPDAIFTIKHTVLYQSLATKANAQMFESYVPLL